MRRHTKASSARSKPRHSGGASPPSGHLRLFLLLATAAAFLVVPAAQAMANGTMFVDIEGTGSGEVSSVGGIEGFWEGTPPIECKYVSPGPPTGVCETEMLELSVATCSGPGFDT